MSEIKTNKISPRRGTTTTIGDSGDTVTISSGATLNVQGTTSGINVVQWDTTPKTAAFTAEANKGYFVDTTSASVTVTLPASPVAGSFIGIKDYALTADTNNIIINGNGNKIQAATENASIKTEGGAVNLVYVDSTQGWLTFDAGQSSDIAGVVSFTAATGGTVTTCGDFKIHTFTAPGTFCVSSVGNNPVNPLGGPSTVDYMVVAGGGGGGGQGGGGAGGYREAKTGDNGCYTASPLATPTGITLTVQGYPISVGGGGTGGGPVPGGNSVAPNGSNSVFSTITSAGGGGGQNGSGDVNGSDGGSGGGGGFYGTGGAGNTPPVSPAQGTGGGTGATTGSGTARGGGGGGATVAGSNAAPGAGGAGGAGATTSINATPTARAGGGGGGGDSRSPGKAGGAGGTGGGGAGAGGGSNPGGTAGTTNTGGGGGSSGFGPGYNQGAAGGSGIVIIRYKFQ